MNITKEWIYREIRDSGDRPERYDPPNASVSAEIIWNKIQKEFVRLQDIEKHMDACRSLLNAADDEVLYQEITQLKKEVDSWRTRFPEIGFDGNSVVLPG